MKFYPPFSYPFQEKQGFTRWNPPHKAVMHAQVVPSARRVYLRLYISETACLSGPGR
ncbi:hypothetical protein PSCFBP2116_P300081 (plasmid) [Pseudomonas syringae]|nr:hypothetical protein PSCFBP2116_P300081 [Pseudomonas syringae]